MSELVSEIEAWKEFKKSVKKSGECQVWTGRGYGEKGYGLFKHGDFNHLAHRVAFMYYNDYDPVGIRILQSCGNKRCVKEEHLSEEPPVAAAAKFTGEAVQSPKGGR